MDSGNCTAPKITQGQDYSAAKEIVIASGFQTPTLPAYGYSEGDQKVISSCGTVGVCNAYPEIEDCSGQGQCRMTFTDAYRNDLLVFTYGELGKDAVVTGFEIACKYPSSASPSNCAPSKLSRWR